jgi:hypothetical protein
MKFLTNPQTPPPPKIRDYQRIENCNIECEKDVQYIRETFDKDRNKINTIVVNTYI